MLFEDFILQHDDDDPSRLLLARDRYPDIDMDLAVTTLEVRSRLRTKVPEWYAVPSLVYPSRLSGEQCSSSETARYKASLLAKIRLEGEPSNLKVADLTGGMGVDCWAFAQVASEVLYNEVQEKLVKAAALNFRKLGMKNVRIGNGLVESGKVREVLDGFDPDVIFLDPARRAEDGRKVFLIEECQPDVLGLLPELFRASRHLLLKLSPMADITMACRRLGERVKEVHVVAAGGECKELLFLLDREWSGPISLFVAESGAVMEVPFGEDAGGGVRPVLPEAGALLFEPGKALLKAGAFNLPCVRFGLTKLGQHTHLYAGVSVPEELRPFGKVFEILEILPLNNRSMREIGKRFPKAEVTARNIPMTSELLRRKTGCSSGGDIHLWGIR
ncbi:MAG: hypothetical protein IJ701_05535, partial [Bacteroidales bacterium]|nr:hypothetical protein [Bacteroidales bacterium]